MTTKRKSGASGWSSARASATDPDDAEELTHDFFDRAEIVKEGKVVQRGRPLGSGLKEAVKLRIDKDVLARYRASGPGWQSRINETLRQASTRLPKAAGAGK